ncbi:MAG TPA: GEVED domain-containing protein [Isosphaeraceae bacterium]|jgi:hypothetical protein
MLTNGGARHALTGPRLGAHRDGELDGTPTAAADGDDAAGTPNDEDGVTFLSTLIVGATASVSVEVSNAGATNVLDAWIDFNRDGDWSDPGEQVFASRALVAGTNALSFPVPAGATLGVTYARFCLSTAGGLAPSGAAADGEVEDYRVDLVAQSVTGVSVQRGAAGRSFVRYVGLTLGQATGLSELIASVDDADATNDRIRLVGRGLDGSASVAVSLAGRLTALDAALEADFGLAGITGNATSTAGDGYYEFWLDLDGDGTFETVRRFHRLLGDSNASGQVDDADAHAVTLALGQAGPDLAADVNGDGYVTAADRTLARRQAGRKLTGGLALDA